MLSRVVLADFLFLVVKMVDFTALDRGTVPIVTIAWKVARPLSGFARFSKICSEFSRGIEEED